MTLRPGDRVIHRASGLERVVRLVIAGRVYLTRPVHGFYGWSAAELEKVKR